MGYAIIEAYLLSNLLRNNDNSVTVIFYNDLLKIFRIRHHVATGVTAFLKCERTVFPARKSSHQFAVRKTAEYEPSFPSAPLTNSGNRVRAFSFGGNENRDDAVEVVLSPHLSLSSP